jgi:biopolymer transport protein ExbD
MIDVVFLLLVFFMLASQFGKDTSVRLSGAGAGATYSGPPRLIEIAPDVVRLNGTGIALEGLQAALTPLTQNASDTIILRGAAGASLQRLLDVAQVLQASGFSNLVVVE